MSQRPEQNLDPQKLLEIATGRLKRKTSYADVRVTRTETQSLDALDGADGSIDTAIDMGFGIRSLVDGAWGFAASPVMTEREVKEIAGRSRDIARASSLLMNEPIRLAPVKPHQSEYRSEVKKDPFSIPLNEKMELLRSVTALAQQNPSVRNAAADMSCMRIQTWFMSTEGTRIYQEIVMCGAGLSVTAGDRHEQQTRSFPSSHGGSLATGGYERVEGAGLLENAAITADEAVRLAGSPACPSGDFTVILSGDQLSMQLHETVGHPLELDRVYGAELNFSGTSFATPEKRGTLKYASDAVTVVTDPTHPGGLASYGFDDDGVPAEKVVLIHNGVLTGYLSGRETAGRLGAKSSANNRAAGWRHIPINRMSNTILVPGKWRFEDLLADTDTGLYLVTNRSWSIDDRRENFRFECEIAYEIKSGKLGQVFKNPAYSGRTVTFWNSCDAVCDAAQFRLWGTPTCGKGEPSQTLHTAQGASPARFRNVKIEASGKRHP